MDHIRKATVQDASRLAEILIFTKRINFFGPAKWQGRKNVNGYLHALHGNCPAQPVHG